MEVQVPRLVVVPVQLRSRAGLGQQLVHLPGRRVDIAAVDGVEDGAQLAGNYGQVGGLGSGHRLGGGPPGPERGRDGRVAAGAVRRLVVAAARLAGRQRVHQADRDGDDGVYVTVEVHLTSYTSALRL